MKTCSSPPAGYLHRIVTVVGLAIALVTISTFSGTPAQGSSGRSEPQGQDLYAIHCARCHAERYPTEFTGAQWQNLMKHMRVRANLPAAQTELVLKYLRENSGN